MSDATMVLAPASSQLTAEERKVLIAASLGTVFEWYDFVLFGSLAGLIGQQFFSKADPSIGLHFRACWRSPPASSSARWARWCSDGSATSSAANTRFSSPS